MQLTTVPTEALALRTLFGSVPQSVVALCAQDGYGDPLGIAASSFTPISLDPPLVSVAIARTSSTWPRLRERPRLGISLLSESQGTTSRQLAASGADRFAGLEWTRGGDGAVFLAGTVAQLECRLHDELDAGDHLIALFEILAMDVAADADPLIFHRSGYRRLAAAE